MAATRFSNEDFARLVKEKKLSFAAGSKKKGAKDSSESEAEKAAAEARAKERKKRKRIEQSKKYYERKKKAQQKREEENPLSKYRDLAKEIREGRHKEDEAVAATASMAKEWTQYLGGDLEHTHLVKGLDRALLRRLKQANANHSDDMESAYLGLTAKKAKAIELTTESRQEKEKEKGVSELGIQIMAVLEANRKSAGKRKAEEIARSWLSFKIVDTRQPMDAPQKFRFGNAPLSLVPKVVIKSDAHFSDEFNGERMFSFEGTNKLLTDSKSKDSGTVTDVRQRRGKRASKRKRAAIDSQSTIDSDYLDASDSVTDFLTRGKSEDISTMPQKSSASSSRMASSSSSSSSLQAVDTSMIANIFDDVDDDYECDHCDAEYIEPTTDAQRSAKRRHIHSEDSDSVMSPQSSAVSSLRPALKKPMCATKRVSRFDQSAKRRCVRFAQPNMDKTDKSAAMVGSMHFAGIGEMPVPKSAKKKKKAVVSKDKSESKEAVSGLRAMASVMQSGDISQMYEALDDDFEGGNDKRQKQSGDSKKQWKQIQDIMKSKPKK